MIFGSVSSRRKAHKFCLMVPEYRQELSNFPTVCFLSHRDDTKYNTCVTLVIYLQRRLFTSYLTAISFDSLAPSSEAQVGGVKLDDAILNCWQRTGGWDVRWLRHSMQCVTPVTHCYHCTLYLSFNAAFY